MLECSFEQYETYLLFSVSIMDKDIDIMFIVETWLRGDDPVVITECTATFLNVLRAGDCHGGVAVIFRSLLNLSVVNIDVNPTTFEMACVADPSKQVCSVAIYRTPPSPKNPSF